MYISIKHYFNIILIELSDWKHNSPLYRKQKHVCNFASKLSDIYMSIWLIAEKKQQWNVTAIRCRVADITQVCIYPWRGVLSPTPSITSNKHHPSSSHVPGSNWGIYIGREGHITVSVLDSSPIKHHLILFLQSYVHLRFLTGFCLGG